MRHVSVLIALVLLLSCQSNATSGKVAMFAPPPPDSVNWGAYKVTSSADKKVRQYLDAIDSLVDIMDAEHGADIKAEVAKLRKRVFAGHNEVQTWARIMLAYRYAARGNWDQCKAEVSTPKHTSEHPDPGTWAEFPAAPSPHIIKSVSQLLEVIGEKNNARTSPGEDPNKVTIDGRIEHRALGPNPDHELIESWNRILLAAFIAESAGELGPEWQRVKNELDHGE